MDNLLIEVTNGLGSQVTLPNGQKVYTKGEDCFGKNITMN